ncbi:SDR family NAD(P)-dependent oxidoreductase [Frankia gtarii]|uniref:SDR family NAD(P)-dependent oxidoreductase n=1 Tax=Frankia gtarii TaxID=2950102 RepID=UPI0021C0D7DD|nr:SDR family oxidoreductase [Frankia gtarii]
MPARPLADGGPLDFGASSVVVIGGSSGIGLGIARRFAGLGATVTVTGTGVSPEDYKHAEDLVPFRYRRLDVTDDEAVASFAGEIDALDVLVCSQGTVAYSRREYQMETFRHVIEVNLGGTMACCTALHRALAARRGSVVAVGSTSSFVATPGQPAYGASKGGLRMLVSSLARAWARDGMRVNGIAPGFVETKLTTVTRERPLAYEETLERIPLARWGRPDEMGDAAVFLASSMASYITGQMLLVDGGLTL